MDPIRYTPKETADLLGITTKALSAALKKDEYTPEDAWELRGKLQREPPSVGTRKQLFLNFKGGTGKTSLSTSYAWRMAEMGYGVLLIDLDSQGHATKCLGFEGEDFDTHAARRAGEEDAHLAGGAEVVAAQPRLRAHQPLDVHRRPGADADGRPRVQAQERAQGSRGALRLHHLRRAARRSGCSTSTR